MLTALKPRGNPLASGRPGTPSPADGVTVRLRDVPGGPGPSGARVRLFTGLTAARGPAWSRTPAASRSRCATGAAAAPAAGTVTLALAPARGCRPRRPARPGAPAPPGRARCRRAPAAPPEPAQPVYARYWLHGKGPAPAGNLPVAVHLSPGRPRCPVDSPPSPARCG